MPVAHVIIANATVSICRHSRGIQIQVQRRRRHFKIGKHSKGAPVNFSIANPRDRRFPTCVVVGCSPTTAEFCKPQCLPSNSLQSKSLSTFHLFEMRNPLRLSTCIANWMCCERADACRSQCPLHSRKPHQQRMPRCRSALRLSAFTPRTACCLAITCSATPSKPSTSPLHSNTLCICTMVVQGRVCGELHVAPSARPPRMRCARTPQAYA